MLDGGLAEYAQSVALERLVNRRRQRLAYSEYESSYFGGFVPWAFHDVFLARETAGVGRWAYLRAPRASPAVPAGQLEPAQSQALTAKAGLGLGTLERYLGWPTLQRALAVVADTYASKPMSLSDFGRTLGEAAGQDLTWFFDTVFRRSEVFDFAIGDLTSAADTGCGFDPCFRTTVAAQRRGDALFTGTSAVPSGRYESGRALSVVVNFADGQSVRESWDGRAHTKPFVYRSPTRAVSAQIDPDAVLLLDVNHMNDSRTLAPKSARAATRWSGTWMTWLQDLLLSWASLV